MNALTNTVTAHAVALQRDINQLKRLGREQDEDGNSIHNQEEISQKIAIKSMQLEAASDAIAH